MSSAAAQIPEADAGEVDSHFHVFEAGVSVGVSRYVPAYAATLATWRAAAQRSGITRGVVVQTSFMGRNNDLILGALRSNPECLRGVVVIDPAASWSELEAMKVCGVRGIRLNLVGTDHRLDTWQQRPAVWDHLQALGWHVELHTDAGQLAQALDQIPDGITVVLDHMGKPKQVSTADPDVAAVLQRTKHSQVWIKLSGSYRLEGLDAGALARLWCGEVGLDRLIWGSDWPCTKHEQHADMGRLRADLTNWLQSTGDAHKVAAINPRRLYWP